MTSFVAVGGGLGNIIQTTPLVAELAAWGPVDFLVEEPKFGAVALWREWNVPRRVLGDRVSVRPAEYDLIWCNYGVKRFPASISHAGFPAMLESGRPEWDLYLDAVRERFGPLRRKPRTHVAVFSCRPRREQVVLAPGALAGNDLKRWPYWSELAERWKNVAVVGLPTDDRYTWPGHVENLCGKLTIMETALVLKHARLVIANDCGLSHLAAAVDTSTFILFGPTAVVKNRPPGTHVHVIRAPLPLACRPCQRKQPNRWDSRRRTCEFDRACLSELRTKHVWKEVRDGMGL